ncbi:MAG: SRPBCC family protein [Hyphomonadaceae bacterium]
MLVRAAQAATIALLASQLGGCIMIHAKDVEPPPPPAAQLAPPPVATPPVIAVPVPPPPPPVRARIESVEAPTYVTIPMEIMVNKPAKDVWARVGKYCDIAEWFQIAAGCTMTSGKEGEVGSVRSVGAEILVGKTELSYTYTQPVRDGRPYNLYHGTLEVRPVTAKTSKLVYTLVYDTSIIAGDDAAKAADVERRRTAFTRALGNMKILAEGGKLPPPPAPAAPAPAPAKPN